MPQLRPVATSALLLLAGMGSTSPRTMQAGTGLLNHRGERLSVILTEPGIISCSGTDTPGYILLPVHSRTEYLATLARPGDDGSGLLLPAVKNEQTTISVARRFIEHLDPEYTIDDQILSPGGCIGICPDHGEREQELTKNDDRAMLKARQRSGKYCIYSAKTL